MKKAAVVLFILIAAIQATGGFAVGKNLTEKSAHANSVMEKRLAAY